MTWQIEVDSHTCIGSGICASTARAHFRVVAGASRPTDPDAEAANTPLDASEICPVQATTIRDGQTGWVPASQA
jgi:ferredoxin